MREDGQLPSARRQVPGFRRQHRTPSARGRGFRAPHARSGSGTAFAKLDGHRRFRGDNPSRKDQIMLKRTLFGITAVALLSSGAALADDDNGIAPVGQGELRGTMEDAPLLPTGWSVQAGGGVTGFTRESARDGFGMGGYWDARAILGARSLLGAELAYVGSSRQIKNGSGLANGSALVGNGVEALGRINLPLALDEQFRLTPYAFGGVGWTYLQVVDGDYYVARMKDDAHALVVPFGVGTSLTFDRYVVDARFTYRGVMDDDMVTVANGGSQDLQNWSAGVMLGYEF
jgi:hypothetical protein